MSLDRIIHTSGITEWISRIFRSRRDEVTGEWKKLHNEELNDLYSSPNTARVIKSRRTRWAGHVARKGEGRGVYRVLVGKPQGKRPLGRTRCIWEDNIKVDRQEVGLRGYGLDRAGSGYEQLAGTCECGYEPSGSIKCGEFLD